MNNPNNPEVSILVPVFNVDKYIRTCLESISAQTFSDWECILVDDGSSDNSGVICDEFARKDPRFRVLHVKNGGVASARNLAVENAKGKFIAFCDPDDWMEPDCIETMHNLITANDADIVQTDFWREFDGYSKDKHSVSKQITLNREKALILLAKNKTIQSFLWNKMFRREVISPEFPAGQTFEDVHICPKWFSRIRTMVCAPVQLYHYRMRKGSILHTSSTEYRMDYLTAMLFRAEEILKLGLDSFAEREYLILVTKAYVKSAKVIARQEKDEAKRMKHLYALSEKMRSLKIPGIKDLGAKLWFRSNLLASRPKTFARLMRALGKSDLHTRLRNQNLFD